MEIADIKYLWQSEALRPLVAETYCKPNHNINENEEQKENDEG